MSLGKLKVPYYLNVKSKKSYKNQFQVQIYLTTSNRIFKKKNKTQSVKVELAHTAENDFFPIFLHK